MRKIKGIIWLEAIVEKLAWKHQVLPIEVEEVFKRPYRIFKKENGKIEQEDLYNILGRTNVGRYLSVFFIFKLNGQALIISARSMNEKERRLYEKK